MGTATVGKMTGPATNGVGSGVGVGDGVAVRVGDGVDVAVASAAGAAAESGSGSAVSTGGVWSPEQAARIIRAANEARRSLTTIPSDAELR